MESPAVTRLDSRTSTLFRRGQIITKVSDVVRELVDNAVDAGSARVQVLIDNYGLDKIEVRDDGHGIESSQFREAVSGGYSSKLEDTNHLSCGKDYGFRGEALSSICSFATVTVSTKTAAAKYATKYVLDTAGGVVSESRCSGGRGTTVIVRDLFCAYPVRRNYIKEKWRTVTGLKEMENYLKSVGLANPKVYLSLVHNGNSIWCKPVLKTTEEALASIFGVQVARGLSKCGPVEIRPPSQSKQNLVIQLECFLPQVPIDHKLMTVGSNARCVLLVNRRSVHLNSFEKMLRQYIFGMIQSASSQCNLKGKHPVALLKIDMPPSLVDFNREIDKSKVFLRNSNLILEELESMLKAFYPVDFGTIKENLDNMNTNVHVGVHVAVEKEVTTLGVPEVTKSSEHNRAQNIVSFLDEMPSVSKNNFFKSPAKSTGFEKRPVYDSGLSSAGSAEVSEIKRFHQNEKIASAALNQNDKITSAVIELPAAGDSDWAFGRLKDAHGSVLENVSLVRGTKSVPEGAVGATLPVQTLAPTSASNPTTSSDAEFYDRLQNCHNLLPQRLPPGLEPPTKRRRANSWSTLNTSFSSSVGCSSGLPKRTSNPSPQCPTMSGAQRRPARQITLDAFSAFRKGAGGPRNPFPPMGGQRPMAREPRTPFEPSDETPTWARGTDNLDSIWGSFTPTPLEKTNALPFQLMPIPVPLGGKGARMPNSASTGNRTAQMPGTSTAGDKTVQLSSSVTMGDKTEQMPSSVTGGKSLQMPSSVPTIAKPGPIRKSTTPKRAPNLDAILNSPERAKDSKIHSRVIFKKSKEISAFLQREIDFLPQSQIPPQDNSVRVIGQLLGKPLHAVRIESLVGVFSAPNLLEAAPSLLERLPNGVEVNSEAIENDAEAIQSLLSSFPELSTEDLSEEAISRVFALLKDFSEDLPQCSQND